MRTFQLVCDDQNGDPENGVFGFSFRGRSLRVGDAHREAMKSFWKSLLDGPAEAQTTLRGVAEYGLPKLAYARSLLRALSVAGWLRQECTEVDESGESERVMSLEPIAPAPGRLGFDVRASVDLETTLYLKRSVMFAVENGGIIMEAGDVRYVAAIQSKRVLELLYLTAKGSSSSELRGAVPGLASAVVTEILSMLFEVGFLSTEPQEGPTLWAPWEMLFHARTRVGRSVGGYGGTYHFKGFADPAPGLPPGRGGERISLMVPDMEGNLSLVAVSESRRSIRQQDHHCPITLDQLAALLYRVQRTRAVRSGGENGEVLSRPYPSGGSLYELEIYPLVTNCTGLEPGVYHYCSESHELERVAGLDERVSKLAGLAGHTTLLENLPQVVLLITARFPRVMWKYEGVSYAVILKNVGVLYHALTLHATDLGLASCPVGGGDSDIVADILGSDYFEETTVGEVILGSILDSHEVVSFRE